MAASRSASRALPLIVVMGVSGCGKTSVGLRLASKLALPFVEGDLLHPEANLEKMAAGIPLQDEDRWPWLDRIGAAIAEAAAGGTGLVVSCSALRRAYRDRLRRAAGNGLSFLFLHGSREILRQRMAGRSGHFMPPSMLDSQLATLEDPRGEPGVAAVSIDQSIDKIIAEACERLAHGEGER